MSKPLVVLLTHQEPDSVASMLEYWKRCEPDAEILVAYGGRETAFDELAGANKLYVASDRLAVNDLQRELQSYTLLWQIISDWMREQPHNAILFAEYDYVPTAPGLLGMSLAFMKAEGADVCGYRVRRIDGTNHPHYLYHQSNQRLLNLWAKMSIRKDRSVVLSMWGMASLWTRQAFDAVASVSEEENAYLELWLPTVAHHLGFRVRGFPEEQHQLVGPEGEQGAKLAEASEAGLWAVHPAKHCWV